MSLEYSSSLKAYFMPIQYNTIIRCFIYKKSKGKVKFSQSTTKKISSTNTKEQEFFKLKHEPIKIIDQIWQTNAYANSFNQAMLGLEYQPSSKPNIKIWRIMWTHSIGTQTCNQKLQRHTTFTDAITSVLQKGRLAVVVICQLQLYATSEKFTAKRHYRASQTGRQSVKMNKIKQLKEPLVSASLKNTWEGAV